MDVVAVVVVEVVGIGVIVGVGHGVGVCVGDGCVPFLHKPEFVHFIVEAGILQNHSLFRWPHNINLLCIINGRFFKGGVF